MTLTLSSEERTALKNGQPVRVMVPELGHDVVICSAESFEEIIADEKERAAIVRMAMRNTAQRILDDERD